MRMTLVASFVLAISLTSLGGSTLAQTETQPSPSPTDRRAAAPTPETTESTAPSETPAAATGDATIDLVTPKWRKVASVKGPAAREDHTWTVDASGRFAYLFGGRDGGREFADLWRYDLAKDRWKQLSPRGKGPQPRFGHSAVWIEGSGLVVFAGQRGTDFFSDLWVYDARKDRWRNLPARGQVPKRRYGSCMVEGPDGRLWISHGFTDAGRFDDTRAYNLKSQRWAVITPDGRKPGERCLHDCFTSAAGDLVLYGGQDDGHFALGDLWTMGKARAWDRSDDPAAKPRRLYGVTEAGDYAYVFGGAGEDQAKLADVWRVDRETLEFERVPVEGSHPAARYAGTLVTDARRGRILLFGGEAAAGARADVWELVDTAEPAVTPAQIDELPLAEVTPEPVPDPADG